MLPCIRAIVCGRLSCTRGLPQNDFGTDVSVMAWTEKDLSGAQLHCIACQQNCSSMPFWLSATLERPAHTMCLAASEDCGPLSLRIYRQQASVIDMLPRICASVYGRLSCATGLPGVKRLSVQVTQLPVPGERLFLW